MGVDGTLLDALQHCILCGGVMRKSISTTQYTRYSSRHLSISQSDLHRLLLRVRRHGSKPLNGNGTRAAPAVPTWRLDPKHAALGRGLRLWPASPAFRSRPALRPWSGTVLARRPRLPDLSLARLPAAHYRVAQTRSKEIQRHPSRRGSRAAPVFAHSAVQGIFDRFRGGVVWCCVLECTYPAPVMHSRV